MTDRFSLTTDGIAWDIPAQHPGHRDHVEMSGRRVSLILFWEITARGRTRLLRRIYWPTLRHRNDDVRGYLRREIGAEAEPAILIDGIEVGPGGAERVAFDGVFTLRHRPVEGIILERRILPSPTVAAVVERWTLRNQGDRPRRVEVGGIDSVSESGGCAGSYRIAIRHPRLGRTLAPGEALETAITISAGIGQAPTVDAATADAVRSARIRALATPLRLETPDPAIDRLFSFCCLRSGETLFETKMGLVHSPAGNCYYGGIWANDQIEYAGPFFACLGDADAIAASLNAYRTFAGLMQPDFRPIPSSVEVEGDVLWNGAGDRGDAAMYLSGGSRFLLTLGDRAAASELWPALQWCAEYCRRRTDARGVVLSDSDELEGRFPSGDANLSTSCLAYDGYRHGARLARDLGQTAVAADWDTRAEALAATIERHFGAEVEGFRTYRYFAGCTVLRSWICLPLAMGLHERADGTIDALFSPRLWTPDGLATEAGQTTFWDRSTLYGLRGVWAGGAADRALPYLAAYARRRLLGDHAPYPVEAFPEGGQAQLGAEAALLCRVATEGMFGLTATGLGRVSVRPHLPAAWPRMALRGLAVGGRRHDIAIERADGRLAVRINDRATALIAPGDDLEL
jgi:hypothetical protein